MDRQDLEESDKKHIWHPFTQMKDWVNEKPIIIAEGRGCHLIDMEGRSYLDGVSSLWVNIHGHRKKEIDEAIKGQIDKISHSTLLGLSNIPAIELAVKLVGMIAWSANTSPPPSPPCQGGEKGEVGLSMCGRGDPMWSPSFGQAQRPAPITASGHIPSKVFYSDNGSTSVEVALKMAFQYWQHKGVRAKKSFISLNNAYHGDTLGAVSVGGIDIFHSAFGPLLFKTHKAPSPYCYRCELDMKYPDCGLECLSRMEDTLSRFHTEIAALIIEPLIQAAGGMIVSPPGYLKGARELCAKYEVLFIADEVATGFGRTGRMFACEHEYVVPDIICLSKGITGGYLPLALTVAKEEIYNAFLGEFSELKTFFHGHSYTGNPLGCAAALACLEIFEKEKTLAKLGPKVQILEDWLRGISDMDHVGDVRNKGLMAGVELVRDKKTKEPYPWEEKMGWRICHFVRDKGIIIRPLGNVIVIMPPLSIPVDDLRYMLGKTEEAIGECCY
ncbi:MAG TPA: adenosylmethionine--8-amino-7-oxononanoate transaminase [Candidatus Sulfobium mesophilum]|nr:adenosylmethionine--8-amino-7-oxononanoate transaminase [Candidatus Sulfobium mesophilum]